ncbi:GNAT family N-acetyltransferase [Streptomyces sp. NPDC088387]|uniref:GNAT family N-acetyltransferase n=1 Tax=Streptomyces sp. NPDC088387 TaxID=3365859 RepID=UPI003802D2BB
MSLRLVHTSALTRPELEAVRALLLDAFDGDFGDEDWEHSLGGLHAIVDDGEGVVAHGSVVMRRVRHGGRWRRVGYVEGVGVRSDARRTGLGGRVMGALEDVITAAYDFGALGASDDGAALYAARGWQMWSGRISALGPDGVVRLREEEGCAYVWGLPDGPDDELLFDWRDGDVL